MLNLPSDREVHLLSDTLTRYSPQGERARFSGDVGLRRPTKWYMISNTSHRDVVLSEDQKHRKYRQHILSNYKVLCNLSEHHEQFGVVLDDSGLETMLEKLMDDYICPMSRVFPPRVGGLTLDSHHGSAVEYGEHMDIELVLCHGRHWAWCKSYYFWAPGQLSYMVQKHFSVQFFKSSRNIQMIFLLVRRLLTREKRKTTPVSCCIELESLKRDGISASCH